MDIRKLPKPASCPTRGCMGIVIRDGKCCVCERLVEPHNSRRIVRDFFGDLNRSADYEGPTRENYGT
jgi:hypothetical protein